MRRRADRNAARRDDRPLSLLLRWALLPALLVVAIAGVLALVAAMLWNARRPKLAALAELWQVCALDRPQGEVCALAARQSRYLQKKVFELIE